MATTDLCDGDYLGAYRRFFEHFVANLCTNDQLPVQTSSLIVREMELDGEIANIALQHLNQRICPPSLQAYLVKLVITEFKKLYQKQPEDCGYQPHSKTFCPLKLMQTVTNKVNEICQRYLDNSRLALLPPPPSTPLPLTSWCATKNRRRKMEDRSVVLHDLHTMFNIKNEAVVNYYAVFDGHGGQEAATYCAAHLHQYLLEFPHYDPEEPEFALRDAFKVIDNRLIQSRNTGNSGTTAVCALLIDKNLYIAWAGDCQAALISNWKCILMTNPHKPERLDEKARIEALGGQVINYGTWRVNGLISVSRAIGDEEHKPYLTAEPDIEKIELDGSEDLLVLACDGLWDTTSETALISVLYEFYRSNPPSSYSSASEALVNYARRTGSSDNISVIVVFLTPPEEIAAKAYYYTPLEQCASAGMESGYQQQEQQPFELDYGFAAKQQAAQPPSHGHANGTEDGFAGACATGLLTESLNGRHRPKPPPYNDDEDDEDEEHKDEDEGPENGEFVDLGPETNVDAVDDDNFYVLGQPTNDEFHIKLPERYNDSPKGRSMNELIEESCNVVDSEDSEDEWNYYRPGDSDKGGASRTAVNALGQSKDPALVEKSGQCAEEKELCSPKPLDDNNFDNQPLSGTDADVELDADDVTAEYDELHQHSKEQPSELQLKETDTEAESNPILEEELPFDKEPQQQFELLEHSELQEQPQEQQELIQKEEREEYEPEDQQKEKIEEEQEQQQEPQQPQQLDIHDQTSQLDQQPQITEQEDQQEQIKEQLDQEQQIKEQLDQEQQIKEQLDQEQQIKEPLDEQQLGEGQSEEDMESHLNPEAAEFVPTTTTPPTMSQLLTQMDSDLVAGSPLKQSQRALKNRKIPSEEEFKKEICHRPSEIDDSVSDYSNGEPSPQKSVTGFDDDKQCTVLGSTGFLDESEISSTRAEFGDETANFSVASELYKTGISTIDCSYTGSERGDFDFSKDAMTTSMTPGDFKTAFEQEPDLNKVHELTDDDLMGDVPNGAENGEKIIADQEQDDTDLIKNQIDLDLENIEPHQRQSIELFTAIADQKESDSADLFMNMRNAEHGFEYQQDKVEHNLIDTMEQSEVADTEKVAAFPSNDVPVYASNNPFSSDYVSPLEPQDNIQKLSDDMQHINLEEPKEPQLLDDNQLLTPEEPMVPKNVEVEVMHNPLDLNFESTSAEQKSAEPVLVSPVKEPEVMSSKFEEENLMSRSDEALRQEEQHHVEANHVDDFSPVTSQPEQSLLMEEKMEEKVDDKIYDGLERKSINLSESLQEFTGLEEQLSLKQHHEVKDNIHIEEPQILKENLVDEQKDVEEVTAPVPVVETPVEETLLVTNESSPSNEPSSDAVAPAVDTAAAAAVVAAAAAGGIAAATAVTTATAAKSAKPAAAAAKPASKTTTAKAATKTTSPTSPTKTGVTAKTTTGTAAAKKPAPTTTSRPKPATTAAKTGTVTLTKTLAATKSTSAAKTASTTAPKSTSRTAAPTTAAPKPKPLNSVTSKLSADKKPTANGDVKANGKIAPTPRVSAKPTTGTTATSKPGLVKASTTTRTSTSTTAKPRPSSATTTTTSSVTKTTSRLSSVGVGSSTNSAAAARPKTAPVGVNAVAKTKSSVGTKSPMIDKQIKETANKQISSARSTANAAASKTRLSTSLTSAPAKRMSLAPKPPTTGTASPIKKPAPISKPGSKTSVTSKVTSKVTTSAKSTTKVVQNGVCGVEEIKTTTTTTTNATTNIEEDMPKKDVSPIEPVTDNQLITAE